jgi:hypothetical protein
VISNAGTGYPAFWSQARERVLSGNPGPVVKRATYKNYILASDGTILQERSSDVNSFLSRQLLPAVPSNIYSHYLSDKVVFAGFVPPNARAWQDAVGKLNAALGNELRGDLLLVLVDAKKVPNADAYIMALKARWQDVTAFDRNTAAKNTIIVAVGTLDGKTAAWGRAVTGMPSGNELMTTVLNRRLAGTPLTPEAVVGSVRGQIRGQAVTSLHGNGVIESVVFGLENPATRFARVSMNGDSHGGGYLYLKGEIQPSTKAKVWIFLIALAGSLVAWGGAAFFGEPNRRRYSSVPAFRPYRGLR